MGAAALATSTPARVEPVNDIMSTSGWADSVAPTVGPSPLTRLKTPAGTPASSRISANKMALKGAISEGLSTIVQPAANAGATLQAIWLIGQFHGVMKPHTPAGSRITREVPRSSSNSNSFNTPRVVIRWPSPAGAWALFARFTGAPISSLIAAATSPMRSLYFAMMASSKLMRSSRVV